MNAKKGLNIKVIEIYKYRTYTHIFFTRFSIMQILWICRNISTIADPYNVNSRPFIY